MPGIHTVDKREFSAGDYRVEVTLDYWEEMATQSGEAYRVKMTARPKTGGKSLTASNDAPVYRWKGWPWNRYRVKTDVSELIKRTWNDLQQRIDKVTDRTTGVVTVDFEIGSEAAEETAILNGDIDDRLMAELASSASSYGGENDG